MEMNIFRKSVTASIAGFALALCAGATAAKADQIIQLYSGNGTLGSLDSQVTLLEGPADAAFGSTFTATDFSNARTGTSASIIGNHGAWISAATFNASASTAAVPAQWISNVSTGVAEGSSALYAIDFTVTDAFISSAVIDFDFAVDNLLGSVSDGTGPNAGLYLNGTALSGVTSGGSFNTAYNFTRADIGGLLVSGTNTLYINSTDVGGPGGLIFSTTITTVGGSTPVPEPGMIAVFGLGLVGLGLARRRARR